jgi:hypothetical protein
VAITRRKGSSGACGVNDLIAGSAAFLIHASRLQTVESSVGRVSAPGFTLAACRPFRAASHAGPAILQIVRPLAKMLFFKN